MHATQAERAAYSKAGARAEAKRLGEVAVADVKQRFKKASAAACEDIGWDFIFDVYDDDGSGELEIDEFTDAVRHLGYHGSIKELYKFLRCIFLII